MEAETGKQKFDYVPFVFIALSAVAVGLCYDFLFIPAMTVLPALWAAAAFRTRKSVVVFAVLVAFTVVYGRFLGYEYIFTLRMLLLVAPSSILLYMAHRFRLGNTQAALYLSVSVTFGLFAIFCLNSLHQGKPAFYEVSVLFGSVLSTLEAELGPSSALVIAFTEYINSIEVYFPSVLYSFGALYALTNVLLLQLFNKKKHLMDLVPIRPFGQWRLPRSYVFACGIVMLFSLILSFTGSVGSKAEMILNLSSSMLNMPLSVVGAGMLYFLLTRNKKTAGRTVLFVLILILLLLIGVAMYMLPILGFFGSVGFRRRPEQS